MSDAQIINRWSTPNEVRKAGLNKLDGFSWEESEKYDALERRESTLLDLMEARRLRPHEEEEMKEVQHQLHTLQEHVSRRRTAITAAAA